jgi:hypothetical protein
MYVEERGGGRERASERQSWELCVMIVSPSLSEWRDDGGERKSGQEIVVREWNRIRE